jgi:predicted transcriptional regulator
MATTKKTVQAVLDTLPEDCSLEDVQYQLYLRQRLQKSVAAAAAGRVVTHDEVKKRLAKWVAK